MITWYKVIKDLMIAADAIQDTGYTLLSYIDQSCVDGVNDHSNLCRARRLARRLNKIYGKMIKLCEEATK